eukprot:TRINITY_DN1905_c0_g3_i2.p1 TRINITY_DN1905_c0_g3~~TRINITY_DN1905_c0_g3_i2.p1  ORF type:complete len:293 (-),score=93.36 TRINITY_DN1905_c0_g3_i2:100-936(-)
MVRGIIDPDELGPVRVVQAIREGESEWWEYLGERDERVLSWPLMSTPYPTIAVSVGYVFVVFLLLRVMSTRTAFSLKPVVLLHNLFLVALSLYMGVEIARNAYNLNYSFVCNKVQRGDDGNDLANVLYIFYLSKAYEMIDTMLMCLRKKTAQVSFLHVYHHLMTFLLWWIGIYFVPGGDSYMSAMINCFVHVVMYSYYFFSALGFRVWFKKYITQMQLIQFFIGVVHCVLGVVYDCGREFAWMYKANALYMTSFIILFGSFYINSYGKKDSASKKKKQ